MYGKATETAIAALSRLAEVYDEGKTRLSAQEIALDRHLQKPFVGKVLTTLSQAGIVQGSRGPGGGFTLAMEPGAIRIYDVFRLFERAEDEKVDLEGMRKRRDVAWAIVKNWIDKRIPVAVEGCIEIIWCSCEKHAFDF